MTALYFFLLKGLPAMKIESVRRDAMLPLYDLEKQLIEAACAGDHGAFTVLCERHARRVYRAILRVTRNEEDAQDALQDALLRAYLHLGSFDGRSQFSSWLVRIGINSALGLLRRNRARPQVPLDDEYVFGGMGEEGLPDCGVDMERNYMEREHLTHLRHAVARLRPKLREVLVMHHALDCSTRELALRMGMSESAVKSRLMRARREVMRSWSVQKMVS
ncbi:RNA polymerase sigma factor [Silvibacterium dinghuense]|uniref:Sigma-70 family RNA polymerase sigma factor n=1 Tax=Silvibacterium dinghuense TaxID=1560006 RepID=A0A4Q1SDB1_9BACT|nr:sigma-70 family RNA polymerase sigma factor [Silvibacterium dinghuense]RXS95204.1 sigma-70 family RNA polymerase sigma factor [Silvibacterium dinghuense]GGH11509.1 ECF-family RNA polymerase sigma factor [Silvibacterium dinghuense]